MPETPTAADALEDIQDVCYRAIHHAAFNTSDKMVAALVPLIDRAKAAELRRIANVLDDGATFADHSASNAATGLRISANRLRVRADELDPPAPRET